MNLIVSFNAFQGINLCRKVDEERHTVEEALSQARQLLEGGLGKVGPIKPNKAEVIKELPRAPIATTPERAPRSTEPLADPHRPKRGGGALPPKDKKKKKKKINPPQPSLLEGLEKLRF
jgi:hypothetical protein